MADSAFLTKDDFITIITVPALDALTNYDDAILEEMITEAVYEMITYLDARYDLSEIFLDGGGLLPNMKMYCKDIVLFHLHSRHHHRPMPDIRAERYAKAIQWLKDIQSHRLNPFALIDVSEASRDLVVAGSNAKRNNYQD